MTKDEIKEALKMCSDACFRASCPYGGVVIEHCFGKLKKDALDLITEQEKEIEFQVQDRARLQREIDELEQAHEQRVEEIEQLKADNKVWSAQVYQAYDNGYKDGYDSIEEDIIQAKIDVLTELKEKYGFYSCYSWNYDVKSLNEIVDEMIEELKK